MALINCPDCDKQVSSNAPACPNCGCPIASTLEKQEPSEAAENAPSQAAPRGSRVPHTDQEVAVLISQKSETSHLLHLILSLFTCGLWLPVWLVVGFVNSIDNDLIDSKIAGGKNDEPKSWRQIAADVPAGLVVLAVLVVGYVLTVLVMTLFH